MASPVFIPDQADTVSHVRAFCGRTPKALQPAWRRRLLKLIRL